MITKLRYWLESLIPEKSHKELDLRDDQIVAERASLYEKGKSKSKSNEKLPIEFINTETKKNKIIEEEEE